jgi:hypothetical protein
VTQHALARYAAYFHELDAWTEYWDIYHPETRGRFYFGDGGDEVGLLTAFLPRAGRPPAFEAWTRRALYGGDEPNFARIVRSEPVRSAVAEVDDLVADLFVRHFGDAAHGGVRADYLAAMHHFACDTLPAASDRAERIAADDPRKRTAGRHTLDGDIMWFAWALQLEAAQLVQPTTHAARHALLMAGVATGCAANFVTRADRRTRSAYVAAPDLAALVLDRGLGWADDFAGATDEVHALFRIRQWGEDEA